MSRCDPSKCASKNIKGAPCNVSLLRERSNIFAPTPLRQGRWYCASGTQNKPERSRLQLPWIQYYVVMSIIFGFSWLFPKNSTAKTNFIIETYTASKELSQLLRVLPNEPFCRLNDPVVKVAVLQRFFTHSPHLPAKWPERLHLAEKSMFQWNHGLEALNQAAPHVIYVGMSDDNVHLNVCERYFRLSVQKKDNLKSNPSMIA